MSATSKNAILKAMIDGAITELMIKSTGDNIYLTDGTTIASKIASMVADIDTRAKSTDVTTQIQALKDEILGTLPDEAYDTLTEIAEYIKDHQEVFDALKSAINDKADKTAVETIQATINSLGTLATKSVVTESDLDSDLKTKIDNASEGNHSHTNKAVLDGITATKVSNWDSAVTKAHSHANKTELDKITAGDVAIWNAKSRVIVSSSQPSDLTTNDLWISI